MTEILDEQDHCPDCDDDRGVCVDEENCTREAPCHHCAYWMSLLPQS